MRVGFVSLIALLLGPACHPALQPLEARSAQPLSVATSQADVVWLLDNSGSMQTKDVCDAVGDGGCESRKDAVTRGLTGMLALLSTASHAAVLFPSTPVCGGPTSIVLDAGTDGVTSLYAAALPAGGTPTASALAFLAARPLAQHHTGIAVLVTDGVPNCSPDNPNNVCTSKTPAALAACQCTTVDCTAAPFCSLGCLDDLGTVEAGRKLGEAGYELMVLAVGPDFGPAASPFSSMRVDLQPTCASPDDCGGRACSDGRCVDRAFRVVDGASFSAPGQRLERAVAEHQRCLVWLEREVLPDQLSLTIDGQPVPSEQWALQGTGGRQHVRFSGAACERLLSSDPATTVEARLLQ